jgi:hypothetical protein
MTRSELFRTRLFHQGLLTPTTQIPAALNATVGLQAQQLRQAESSIALRSQGLHYADLQLAYTNGSVVRSWAQRWTYQLFTRSDWALAIASRRGERLPSAYFFKEKDRVLALAKVLTDELQHHASLSRDAVATILANSSTTPVSNNLRYAVLQVVAARGYFAFNPLTDDLQRMAVPTMATDETMQTLMRRFVRGFGPVSLKDFCKWSGISVTHARANWTACVPDWQTVNYAGETLYLAETTSIHAAVLAQRVILISGFDATLTAYADKNWLAATPDKLWTRNGILNPYVIIDGQISGTWSAQHSAKQIDFHFKMWTPVDTRMRTQIASECARVAEFYGKNVGLIDA